MENNLTLILTGDLQIKNRVHNLTNSYEKTCTEIEQIVIDTKADIVIYAGDMLEYPTSNDSERKILYNHFSNLLNIHSLKELVAMNGNHDIDLGKKSQSLLSENNPLDTYYTMSKTLSPERAKKLNYLKFQKEYKSVASENISWISYSLEDGTSSGSNLKLSDPVHNVLRIPVFHDILKEYVDDKKLPISKSKYDYLMEMNKFPAESPLILAADIHERYTCYKNNQTFLYPGSSVQRNHGEGSYLKIRKNPLVNKAPTKYVLKIDIKLDTEDVFNSSFEVTEIPLKNSLHYITIDFNTKTFVEDWKDQLEDGLLNLNISRNVNIFKLMISNVYMKQEMEILTVINNFFETHNKKFESTNYLELSYGQIVFDSDDTILEAELNDASENDDTEEFDIEEENIVLNTDKLKTIFGKVIDSYSKSILKEFPNPEEFSEVVEELNSLFNEQIELFYGNRASFNIELDKIKTNGFMALGMNEIDLDIPGLTRIVGNNGIGKTTLYNMLRWTIKNMVIEGLPKNTKKENLLLVFNDENIEQDKIHNLLNFRVNNIPVTIERVANRTWKKSATLENKQSKNWKEYIDTVATTLKLTIFHENKEPSIKLNDEAQNIIDTWFGNVPENIMILNQFKILQLLNTSGNALNEMVLEFAGVDYLKSLEENLDIVKSQYQVSKPDKAQMDILIEKNKIVENLETNKSTITDNEIKINDFNEVLKIEKNNLEIKLQEKINLGNIPEKIKEISDNLISEQNKRDSFEIKEIKELPVFALTEPDKPITTDLEDKIKEQNEKVEEYVNLELEIISSFNTEKSVKLEKINEFHKKFTDEINIFISEKETEFINKTDTIRENIKSSKTNVFNYWNNFYNNIIEDINIKIKENTIKNNELINEKNKLVENINNRQNIIDSGICNECNRPLDNVEEKINKAKEEIIEFTKDLEIKKSEIESNKNSAISINEELKSNSNKIKSITNLFSWSSNLSTLDDIKKELVIIENNKDTFESENLLIDNYTNLVKLFDDFSKINLDEYVVSRKENLTKFSKLKDTLSTLNLQSELTEDLLKIVFLQSLFDLISKFNSNATEIKIQKTFLKDYENTLNDIKNEYNTKLDSYNKELSDFNNSVTNINKFNSSVNEHNNYLTIIESNIKRLEIEFDDIKNKEYEYEKVNREYNEINDNVLVYEQNIKDKIANNYDLTNANNLMDINLKILNDLEIAWKEYRKKNFIYKTFEKLIKKDFKHAIFNFYRQFLNNKLNILLEGLDFRLYWNNDSQLYLIKFSKNSNGETETVYRPVKLASGMQTSFLGLSLIYTIHLLNVRNSISHIFIDEISGQLNSGKNKQIDGNLDDLAIAETKNYQEQLVFLLNKFTKKKIFIIDHVIENFWETKTIEVVRKNINGKKLSFYQDI